MAKKRTGLSQTLFQEIDPYGQGESGGAALQAIPLAAVRPDPAQPRRLLPPSLARQVAQGSLAPLAAMRTWTEEVAGAPAADLEALRRLAESIARHGLINAISVRKPRAGETAPAGVGYFIVTGERRYWAHVLLVLEGRTIRAGEQVREPTEIAATVVAPGITVRAHQLIENIMREDINAVEKARGLWALRYELSGVNDSAPGIEVNYGSPPPGVDLVPWTRVSDEVGISKRYRIYLTSVLELSAAAQDVVMEHDLAEITIRPIVQKLRTEPALQLQALRQLVAWQQENKAEDGPGRAVTRSVQALVDELLARKAAAGAAADKVRDAAEAIDHSATTRKLNRRVRALLRFLGELHDDDVVLVARDLALDDRYSDANEALAALVEQLDDLLDRVETYQAEA
jgi:hypothetical protein